MNSMGPRGIAKAGPSFFAPSGRRCAAEMASAATIITRRQPNLAVQAPEIGIVTTEPMPRHNRSSPSAPSLMSARALANGTSAAHVALPKPVMKQTIRVARYSATPGICRGMTSEIAIDTFVPPSLMGRLCS